MKQLILAALFLMLNSAAHAEIYKWVDANGRIHFSDKPNSKDAEEIKIRGTGITLDKTDEEIEQEKKVEEQQTLQHSLQDSEIAAKKTTVKKKDKEENEVISEADYKITVSVGKLGADAIRISGRIGRGPVCKSLNITATASNENGLSTTITQQVRKISLHGSTVFEGTNRVSGSGEDRGFWKVDKITITCND